MPIYHHCWMHDLIWSVHQKPNQRCVTWAKCPPTFSSEGPHLCCPWHNWRKDHQPWKDHLRKSAQSNVETSTPEGMDSGCKWASYLLCDLIYVPFLSGAWCFQFSENIWMGYFSGTFWFWPPQILDDAGYELLEEWSRRWMFLLLPARKNLGWWAGGAFSMGCGASERVPTADQWSLEPLTWLEGISVWWWPQTFKMAPKR